MYSVRDLAHNFDCAETYIYKLVRTGRLKPYRTSPLAITEHDLLAYLTTRLPKGFKAVKAAE